MVEPPAGAGEPRTPSSSVPERVSPPVAVAAAGVAAVGAGITPELRTLSQAARAISGGGGFGGGGRGGGGQTSLVDAGQYTVVLTFGDREFRQPLTILKGPDAGS